ncbi:hypothetical protein BH10CHL1_BH10CHL1_42230 [soil metagenome]
MPSECNAYDYSPIVFLSRVMRRFGVDGASQRLVVVSQPSVTPSRHKNAVRPLLVMARLSVFARQQRGADVCGHRGTITGQNYQMQSGNHQNYFHRRSNSAVLSGIGPERSLIQQITCSSAAHGAGPSYANGLQGAVASTTAFARKSLTFHLD